MPPSAVGWPVPRNGLGLFLGDLLQVCLPVRLVLVQGSGDHFALLLSHLRLSLDQPARAFAAFACGSRLLWLLILPSIKMLAALLISPTTVVPSFGTSPSASAGRRP